MTRRYAVILGNLGNTRDRFCPGYKDNPDTLTMLRQAAAIPHVDGIELVGTWDVTPESAGEMKRALDDAGKACVSIIPDLFTQPQYARGSYASPDGCARQDAIDHTRRMAEAARTLGCRLLNLWPGQDGFDYLLATDHMAQRDRFRDAVAGLADEFPDLRFALEYKPKEPRCFSLCARMADTLLMCQEIGRDNVGVCIDTGHAYVAGESVGEAIVLAGRAGGGDDQTAGRLFHMHFNDNHGLWDDDMIVGSLHSTTYFETLYWLDRCGYGGWLSMDQYPYREDAAEAIGESIAYLREVEARVDRNRQQIDRVIAEGDTVAACRLLRRMQFEPQMQGAPA